MLRFYRASAVCAFMLLLTSQVQAQATPTHVTAAPTNDSAHTAAHATSTLHRLPPREGFADWAGTSFATFTASDNENVHGYMRIIGVQWSHDLFAWREAKFSWVTEVLPLMLVNSSAPPARIPTQLRNPALVTDLVSLATYQSHDSWGAGISPLSAQAEIQHTANLSTILQVTSGGAWFSKVVPFGRATQLNFTVSPSVALQWKASQNTRVAIGYTLHHLSNGSFGRSNPGMNSHMLLTRITSVRAR